MLLKVTALLGSLGALALLMNVANAQSAPQRSARHLYFDQTHEFLFAVDHLAGMLHEYGFNAVMSRDTFPPADLKRFDVLLVHQSSVHIDFDARSLRAIQEFVRNGGGLYLMANRPSFERYAKDKSSFPIEKVLALFGLAAD